MDFLFCVYLYSPNLLQEVGRKEKQLKEKQAYPRAVQLTWYSGGFGEGWSGVVVVCRTGSPGRSRPRRGQGPAALASLPSSHSGSQSTALSILVHRELRETEKVCGLVIKDEDFGVRQTQGASVPP